MLKKFHALPTEERAKSMKNRDYLWCLVNDLLDREERLEHLCPSCREKALERRCPVCGKRGEEAGETNPAFDLARFERLKGGGTL